MGVLGLRPREYYDLTWRQYVLTVRGFSIKRAYTFENTRAIYHLLWNVNRGKTDKFKTQRELWPIITDPDENVSEAEMEEEGKRMQALLDMAKNIPTT